MKSFLFWLSAALGLGALIGSAFRPGVPEILLVLAVLNGLVYGLKKISHKNRIQNMA